MIFAARNHVLRTAAAVLALALGCADVAVSNGSLQQGDASTFTGRRAQDAGVVDVASDKDGASMSPPEQLPVDATVSAAQDGEVAAIPDAGPLDAGPAHADAAAVAHDAASDDDASLAACDADDSCPVCVASEAHCEGMTPFVCDDEGVFQPGPPCEGPAWICQSGACVQNEITTIGLAEATTTQHQLSALHFHATRVTTQGAATLKELRVLAHQAGGFVRLALYSDRVDGGVSRPGAFVAGGIDSLHLAGGEELTTPRGWHELMADTTYWIVAITSSTASVVYARSDAAGSVVSAPYPAGFGFSASFPAEFPTADIEEDAELRLSFHVGVQTLDP